MNQIIRKIVNVSEECSHANEKRCSYPLIVRDKLSHSPDNVVRYKSLIELLKQTVKHKRIRETNKKSIEEGLA